MSIETGEGILKVKRMGLMVMLLKRVRKHAGVTRSVTEARRQWPLATLY